MNLSEQDVKAIVAAVLAEQAKNVNIDATVLKTVATILSSFGITDDDRLELKADFLHLRKWRKSVDAATGLTFNIIVGTIVTGIIGAIAVGMKAWFGK